MVNRFTGPIVVFVLFIAAMIWVCYGFETLLDRMTPDLAFGVVTLGALGLALLYICECTARFAKI
jgi:hypothetical protein